MVADLIDIVPPWMLLGSAIGGVASVAVAIVFYVGTRLSPPTETPRGGATGTGDERRHREIRAYLAAIGERFHEEHELGDVVVPFYLPERGVAITFDAHDYFRLEGSGVFTVLCEHELPGHGLGRRLPFDVDEPDWGPGSRRSDSHRPGGPRRVGGRSDPIEVAFAELGVPTDADAAAVKHAYRERVKEVHPDQGGDEATFRRVREAYATASNHAAGNHAASDRVSNGRTPGDRTTGGSDRRGTAPGFGRRT